MSTTELPLPPVSPDQAPSRAFWVDAPGVGVIRGERLPPLREADVLVRALFSAISRGTEALVFEGRVPETEWTRMRAPYQAGDFPAPVKYGYCNVGIVEAGPAALKGRTVFALHPHQTRYVVPATAVHVVPDTVPAPRAVLAANMETAVNGLWDAAPAIGDRITVIGAGAVGCLVASLAARIPGCQVELVDVNPRRAPIARALGAQFAEPATAARERDLVIHASGSTAGLALALELAAFEARVIELSWHGDRPVTVPLGGAFHARRLTLVSSQVGTVAPAQRARWTPARRMATALSLLADPALDALITDEIDFDALPVVMARLSREPGETICCRIRY